MAYATVYKRKPTKKEAASGCFPDGFKWGVYRTLSHSAMHYSLRESSGGRTYRLPGREHPHIVTNFTSGMFPLPKYIVASKDAEEVTE